MLSLLQCSHEACWFVGLGAHCLILARRGHVHARRRGKGVLVEGESSGQISKYLQPFVQPVGESGNRQCQHLHLDAAQRAASRICAPFVSAYTRLRTIMLQLL